MWCPSASLSVWANAWLAGRAAPDDVLDALSHWAPHHSVMAYDAVAAGLTGLPWPDLDDGGVMSLLQTLRTASGPPGRPAMSVLLPVPGDVRGLPAGTVFARDALTAGEAILITSAGGPAIGVLPECRVENPPEPDAEPDPGPLSWTVYSLPTGAAADHPDLGTAEYALRTAVRSAADALSRLQLVDTGCGGEDPRTLVAHLVESACAHPAPGHAPTRALRVLESAAHVEAIITVGAGLMPIAIQSPSGGYIADDALRPLSSVVRSARLAAVSAIQDSAWH